MGQFGENNQAGNMISKVFPLSLLVLATISAAQETPHNLPVLFQYEEPTHSVAVFRGAQLRQAIAAGLVPGFGNLGSRAGKKIDTSADDMAAAKAAAAASAAAASRPSKLELAEQACIQACHNLAGQCRNPLLLPQDHPSLSWQRRPVYRLVIT